MKKCIHIICLALWMMLIFHFSSNTATDSSEQSMSVVQKLMELLHLNTNLINTGLFEHIIRKLAHFSEFYILGLLAYSVFKDYTDKKIYLFGFTLLLCIIYAASDEIHQYFIPGRACRLTDIIIDSTGSLFSLITIKIFSKLKIFNKFTLLCF